ncbi:MAG: nickel-dependent lactate racemase [Anaerolineae bacterium]|nr:nickel-dependent lactate racemase [Anaerolineae bacterium]
MDIHLDYGKTGLTVTLPDDADITVVSPRAIDPLPDPAAALRRALAEPMASPPLRDLVQPDDTVAIIFSDITRPAPNHLLLPAVLEALTHVPAENIVLCNALGTHRPNTPAELDQMLGAEIARRYRIEQNNCFDPATQVYLGESSNGHPIWINRVYMEADVKILTGFIEPHFFAGFSGGGKAVMPGMAGQVTVLGNHDAGMIGNPLATWGVTAGNPIFEEAREVALLTHPTFLLNVTLNRARQITGVFAGDMITAHDAGIAFARQTTMVPVPEPFDIVITTNSGYPLDMNLYQCGKGMSAAEQIVRSGGAIIMAAECSEGIPDHGLFGEMLRAARSPQEMYDAVLSAPETRQDQWAAQIQARIQMRADVYLYSDHFDDEATREVLLTPCNDIASTVAALREIYGHAARLCVLPEGPQTIPYVAETARA